MRKPSKSKKVLRSAILFFLLTAMDTANTMRMKMSGMSSMERKSHLQTRV